MARDMQKANTESRLSGRCLWATHLMWSELLRQWCEGNNKYRLHVIPFDKLCLFSGLVWNRMADKGQVTWRVPYVASPGIHGHGAMLPLDPKKCDPPFILDFLKVEFVALPFLARDVYALHPKPKDNSSQVKEIRSTLAEGDIESFVGDGAPCALQDIDVATIESWQGSMRHLSDATVRRALNSLSALYRWAVRFGHAASNPLDHVERPKKKRRMEPCPTPDHVRDILHATQGETERATLLALATSGLRRNELLVLSWEDVELMGRRLRIQGKGDKQREVLIFEDLLAALYALRAKQGHPEHGAVFRGRRGRRLQKSTLQRWFNSWLAQAGLRQDASVQARNRFTLHSLRRFAAKRWLESGLNIRQVQILLGHENLQTTILYLNYDLDEIQRAAVGVDFGISMRAAPL